MSKQQRGSLTLRGKGGGTFHVNITVIIVVVGEKEVDVVTAAVVVVGIRRRRGGVGARREMVGACAFISFPVLLLLRQE